MENNFTIFLKQKKIMIYKKELSIVVTKNKEKSCFMFKVYCCTHYHSFIKFCCLSSAKMLLCLRKLSLKKIPIFRSFVESFHTSATLCFWRRFIQSTWRHWIRDWLNFYLYKLDNRKRKEICKKFIFEIPIDAFF